MDYSAAWWFAPWRQWAIVLLLNPCSTYYKLSLEASIKKYCNGIITLKKNKGINNFFKTAQIIKLSAEAYILLNHFTQPQTQT